MANPSKCTLDNIMQSVLSVSGVERNMSWPPYIFSNQFNVVTSLLISKCVERYPSDNSLVDILEPFVRVVKIPVTNGVVNLQAYQEYRNILGAPFINLSQDGKPCGSNEPQLTPQPLDANSFKLGVLKSGCCVTPITILAQSEFTSRTNSTYNRPTHKEPIGYMADKFQIKVCPFDLPTVTVMYVIQEPTYLYGYDTNPDDTFFFNLSKSVESDWTSAAFKPIFEGMLALYAAYVANPELTNFAQILHERNIL